MKLPPHIANTGKGVVDAEVKRCVWFSLRDRLSYAFFNGAIPRASFLTPLVRKAMVARVPSIFMTMPFPNVGCCTESPGRSVSGEPVFGDVGVDCAFDERWAR